MIVDTHKIACYVGVTGEPSDSEDVDLPGFYQITIASPLALKLGQLTTAEQSLLAIATLDSFHDHQGIEVLDDFDISVFLPDGSKVIEDEDVADTKLILEVEHIGKVDESDLPFEPGNKRFSMFELRHGNHTASYANVASVVGAVSALLNTSVTITDNRPGGKAFSINIAPTGSLSEQYGSRMVVNDLSMLLECPGRPVYAEKKSVNSTALSPDLGHTAFKPSFPNPEVWTDAQIVQRHAEYSAFQESDVGRAEDRAFDATYSEHETRRESGLASQTQAEKCLDELRTWPSSAKVADLYDTDEVFAAAIKGVFGPTFEYPDYAWKRVGQLVLTAERYLNSERSLMEAEQIAKAKESFRHVDPSKDELMVGKVLGVTSSHVVLSLGRSAVVLSKQDLDRVPTHGEDVTLKLEGGKGRLGHAPDLAPDKGVQR